MAEKHSGLGFFFLYACTDRQEEEDRGRDRTNRNNTH